MANTASISFIANLNPLTLIYRLWKYRNLIVQFTRREVESRYRGSFLGIIWSFINPLFMLSIYTFVFGLVLKAKWPQAKNDNLGEFAVITFCGLIAFNMFSECINRAPTLVITVPNYVKKVIFPLEILPVSLLGASLFQLLISLVILICAMLILSINLSWTIIFLPIVMIPLIFIILGLTWFLASLGVFIRDISQAISLITQALFLFTPIFYSIEAVPQPFRQIIELNPLTQIVSDFRDIILWGNQPNWAGLGILIIVSSFIMVAGFAWFIYTKKAFADVI